MNNIYTYIKVHLFMTTQVEINILYLCIFFLIDLDYKHLVEKQNIFSRQSFSNFYTNAYKM